MYGRGHPTTATETEQTLAGKHRKLIIVYSHLFATFQIFVIKVLI